TRLLSTESVELLRPFSRSERYRRGQRRAVSPGYAAQPNRGIEACLNGHFKRNCPRRGQVETCWLPNFEWPWLLILGRICGVLGSGTKAHTGLEQLCKLGSKRRCGITAVCTGRSGRRRARGSSAARERQASGELRMSRRLPPQHGGFQRPTPLAR